MLLRNSCNRRCAKYRSRSLPGSRATRSAAALSWPPPAIFASPCGRAKFGIPVAKFGFLAPVPDTLRLVQLVGTAKAKWLLMTGQLIEAPEAQAIGLIDQVVEPEHLEATVNTLAATLAANAPLTIKATKQIIETMSSAQRKCRVGSAVVRGNFSQSPIFAKASMPFSQSANRSSQVNKVDVGPDRPNRDWRRFIRIARAAGGTAGARSYPHAGGPILHLGARRAGRRRSRR